jgi:hypothetical protein
MTDISKRKTLTIKNKPCTMYPGPTKIDQIEAQLKLSIEAIFKEHSKATATYNEQFKLHLHLKRQVESALEDFKKTFRYPAQLDQIFKKICENVHDYLDSSGMDANEFKEVYHSVIEPKKNSLNVPASVMKNLTN